MTTIPPLIVTIVRHGESVDNVRNIWAGHKDSPLSNHGNAQAGRVGSAFSSLHISHIYTSDLQRAFQTAQHIKTKNLSSPPSGFTVTESLREQNFGEAEGHSYDSGEYSASSIPWNSTRDFNFPSGECLDDVRRRARSVIRNCVLPHLYEIVNPGPDTDPTKPAHIVLVAHGILIAELMAVFFELGESRRVYPLSGLGNTAWNRLEVWLANPGFTNPGDLPALRINLTDQNRRDHLQGLVRQKGGIGSSAYDERQRSIKDYFGGGGGAVSGKM